MTDVPVRISAEPLSVEAAYRELDDPASGAVVLLVGRVRPDPDGGRRVQALLYEAHRTMALRALRRLERAARAGPGVRRVLLWHRIGRLKAGTPSVIVGVAAPHRAAAFRTAARLISQLKAEAPIWKTELWRSARPRRRPPRPSGGP
ncbi:MAG: molybdenum cofactor biosynthesis protein MoaE [Thermoplasmata archaeon]